MAEILAAVEGGAFDTPRYSLSLYLKQKIY